MNIVLSPFGLAEDAALIARWIADPDYAHFFQSIGMVPTMEECKNYPRWTGNSVMMIRSAEGPETIGMVSMYRPVYRNGTAEAGVLIDKRYQGSGAGRAATLMWVEYLVGLGFRKIVFNVINPELRHMLEKNGCVLEGVHEAEVNVGGVYVDEYRLAYMARGKRAV